MRRTIKPKPSTKKLVFKWPRQSCGYCSHLIFTWCEVFDSDVPASFKNEENSCEHFDEAMSP